MASATKSKKQRKQELEAKRDSANAEFRDQQKREAADQGNTSSNAVPEQRPVASQQVSDANESPQYLEELKNGERDPMPKSAYYKAASSSQLAKAEDEEQSTGLDTLTEGAIVRITTGVYRDAVGAVTKVNYADFDEKAKATSGDPAVARFAKASSYMVRTRGGAHALVEVKPDDLELARNLGVNASEA